MMPKLDFQAANDDNDDIAYLPTERDNDIPPPELVINSKLSAIMKRVSQ